ncbi:MAG: hypothetical protein LQ345_007434, partial [Seirophora villosa]
YALNFTNTSYRTSWVALPDVAVTRQKLGVPACRKHADGSDFSTLPILHDQQEGTFVGDSFDIAIHLHNKYFSPDNGRPPLFPSNSLALHRVFNAHVDALFSLHGAPLAGYYMPLDPATAEISRADFARRAGVSRWEDLEIPLGSEERKKKVAAFEAALGSGLAAWFVRRDEGPFLEGRTPMYADLIVGGWLQMMRHCLPEWEELRGWNEGLWGQGTEDELLSAIQTSSTQSTSTTGSSTKSFPLTKTNLQLLQFIMSGNPVTPSQRSKSTKSSTTAVESTPSTPSNQKLTLREVLRINGMHMMDMVYDDYPALQERADQITASERNSAMRPESAKRLERLRQWYQDSNENTLMVKWWTKLFKDERDVRVEETQEETPDVSDLSEEFWASQSWDIDGLDESWDKEFRKDSLPKLDLTDRPAARLVVEQNERVKNPKPDICFGVRKDVFTIEQQDVNNLYTQYAGISKHIRHPACIVEGKLNQTMDEVQAQCCRGGAALLYATRKMMDASGADVYKPGADLDSFVFSLALIPSTATLFMHWAEVKGGKRVLYHMNDVTIYHLRKDIAKAQLRHDLNNILEWMLYERLPWIKTILDAIHKRLKSSKLPLPPFPVTSSTTSYTVSEGELQSEPGGVPLPLSERRNKRQRTE